MPEHISTLGDLGWLPVLDHLDTLQVSYVNHLCQNGWYQRNYGYLQQTLGAILQQWYGTFRYLSSIKDIFTCMGMDNFIAKDATIDVPTFKESVIRSHQIQFTQNLDNYNSLLMY